MWRMLLSTACIRLSTAADFPLGCRQLLCYQLRLTEWVVYCYYYYRLFVHALVAVGYHSAYALIGWALSHDKLLSADNKMLLEKLFCLFECCQFPLPPNVCVCVCMRFFIWLIFLLFDLDQRVFNNCFNIRETCMINFYVENSESKNY